MVPWNICARGKCILAKGPAGLADSPPFMKNPPVVFVGCLVWSLCLSLARAVETVPVISIAEARAQFARGVAGAVRVEGQVTFSNHKLGLAFVQDETGGIGFDPRLRKGPTAKVGERVELSGVLTRRQGMVMILRDEIKLGAPKITPAPSEKRKILALPFDLDHATQMRIDGLLTRVSGVVRRVTVSEDASVPMMVEISSPNGHALARLAWREPQAELDRWMNAAVTFNAVLVCQAEPKLLRSGADALLLIPGKTSWSVQTGALDEVFARPAVKLSNEMLVSSRATVKNRVHVTGVVTAHRPGLWLSLRTAEGSVQVMTRQTGDFKPGETLSVACWPQSKSGRLIMLDGVCRSAGRESDPEPVPAGLSFDAMSAMPMELVRARGMVRNHSLPGGMPRLTLWLEGGQSCLLQWSTFLEEADAAALVAGSVMDVTGILNPLPAGSGNESGVNFSIQPRGLADLVLVRSPSWWTRTRLQTTIWSLVGVGTVAVMVALLSGWQVGRQRVQLRAIEARVIADDERRRIAREFHDSLQQQLASAALHLETMKGAVEAAPEMLPRLIDDTTAMIRHSQMEARHCIWGLRTDAPTHENLAAVLAEWLHMRGSQITGTALHFELRGEVPPLDDDVPFQILRITQEAVNNALAHAAAQHVHVRIYARSHELLLEIQDDGRGFDPKVLRQGRFGLNSQQERAQKISAELRITSPPDNGTRVTLRVPTLQPNHATICRT